MPQMAPLNLMNYFLFKFPTKTSKSSAKIKTINWKW